MAKIFTNGLSQTYGSLSEIALKELNKNQQEAFQHERFLILQFSKRRNES